MIYVGLDDTDNERSRGTGHLSRMLAQELQPQYEVRGITRHQLLLDPRVPYTAKNSCATLHLNGNGSTDLAALTKQVMAFVWKHSAQGSDPAICVAQHVPPEASDFGHRAQRCVIAQVDARRLAQDHDITLVGLGGTEDGVIGALAAVGLAATGQDGRFISLGTVRELDGDQPVEAILESGVAEVRDLEGHRISSGVVATEGRLRPAFRESRAILYVRRNGTCWLPVKLD